MGNISILNSRHPNINSVQRVNTKNNICDIDKNTEKKINDPFVKLRSNDKSISNITDLKESSELVKKEELAKRRLLTKQENSGYVFIGALTFMGTAAIAATTFMIIKLFLIK